MTTQISTHFTDYEFGCKCRGTLPGCKGKGNRGIVQVGRDFIRRVEKLRSCFYQGGLLVVSGYRCPARNEKIGGAKQSTHMDADPCLEAMDIPGIVNYKRMAALKLFHAIGYNEHGLVIHIDMREGYTPEKPLIFKDGWS